MATSRSNEFHLIRLKFREVQTTFVYRNGCEFRQSCFLVSATILLSNPCCIRERRHSHNRRNVLLLNLPTRCSLGYLKEASVLVNNGAHYLLITSGVVKR